MFILMAIMMMSVGVLLLIKASKIPKWRGVNIVWGICAVLLVILGAILFYGVLSRKIKLPLH
ncbi:hypothetical protein [Streptococcus minor]|uniref:hypothetical protein n=1 Tax=Streptococcus minor TaxID=229549 RepID=UPI00037CDBE1|nr:hypothetical protein [Streptococcus minor]